MICNFVRSVFRAWWIYQSWGSPTGIFPSWRHAVCTETQNSLRAGTTCVLQKLKAIGSISLRRNLDRSVRRFIFEENNKRDPSLQFVSRDYIITWEKKSKKRKLNYIVIICHFVPMGTFSKFLEFRNIGTRIFHILGTPPACHHVKRLKSTSFLWCLPGSSRR